MQKPQGIMVNISPWEVPWAKTFEPTAPQDFGLGTPLGDKFINIPPPVFSPNVLIHFAVYVNVSSRLGEKA